MTGIISLPYRNSMLRGRQLPLEVAIENQRRLGRDGHGVVTRTENAGFDRSQSARHRRHLRVE
jgi:hypothetical protein